MSVAPRTAASLAGEALDLMAGRARHDQATVAALVAAADGCRPPLEGASLILGDRLGHRADDFAATKALGLVGAALTAIGWGPGLPPSRRARAFHRRRRAGVWPNRGQLL